MSARDTTSATVTSPAATALTATFTQPLRGTDMVETFTVIRGELGAPHLSVLPVLGDRGPQAEPLARTSAMLDSLYADRQPHGWRITSVPGKDSRAARHVLHSDLNIMADVIGHESNVDRGPVLTSIVGPITLAAGVHVHNGEKLQSDHGARRELLQSWCSGVAEFIGDMARNTEGRGVVVHLDESELQRVLDGTIPTASGYRTLRAIGRQEVRNALTDAVAACRDAGAVEVAINTGRAEPRWARDIGADAAVVVPPSSSVHEWEPLAALVETGQKLWFPVVPVTGRAAIRDIVDVIARPWRDLGMAPDALLGSRVLPVAELERLTPPELPGALRRCTDVAGALTETCNNG
ncbi:hypothetical protein VVR84_03810 [Kocuria carniphila]|uniref:Uncharacterized protein n=1 Tax=Kocuria carniphila TaxID=262208 RepID=A0ABV3V017_9MICC|nr:hypothetical protein [Kocuria carniphila]MCT1802986.1 hypothetical protein [Kocuria carniphila]